MGGGCMPPSPDAAPACSYNPSMWYINLFILILVSSHCFMSHEGAVVNNRSDKDSPLLHAACMAGYLGIVELLLENGAEIDSVNVDHATPLHRACSFNRPKIVAYLLEK